MPQRKEKFSPGIFAHIFNRGNGRRNIFLDDRDRYRFLQAIYLSNNSNKGLVHIRELERSREGLTIEDLQRILQERNIKIKPLVRIMADCLKGNHYHLLLQEVEENGIVRFMQRLGDSYGRYFSIKYDSPGSLFQGRFKAVIVENTEQLRHLLVYINVINPAEIIEPRIKEVGIRNLKSVWGYVEKYKWSTHQEYMRRRDSLIVDKDILGELFPTSNEYARFAKDVLRGRGSDTIQDLMIE